MLYVCMEKNRYTNSVGTPTANENVMFRSPFNSSRVWVWGRKLKQAPASNCPIVSREQNVPKMVETASARSNTISTGVEY